MADDEHQIDYERTKSTILDFFKIFHRAKWAAITSIVGGFILTLLSIGLIMNIPFFLLDNAQASVIAIFCAMIMAIGLWLPISNASLILHVLVKGKQKELGLSNVQNRLIRRSYLMTFEIVNVEGVSRSDRIVRHLALVFPEVKEVVDKYLVKKQKNIDKIASSRIAKFRKRLLIFSSNYDIVIDTETGLYLIKFFDKKVMFDDIEGMVKSLNRIQMGITITGSTKIARVICLAKSYDEFFETLEFVEKIQELKRSFRLDLVLEEDQHGYTTIWID